MTRYLAFHLSTRPPYSPLLCYLSVSDKEVVCICRACEPVLAGGDPPRSMQIQMKRAKQRVATLQRRQWANGVVAFSSKVRYPIPHRSACVYARVIYTHVCIGPG